MAGAEEDAVRRRKKTSVPQPSPARQHNNAVTREQPHRIVSQLNPTAAFFTLFASHVIAALYQPIQDCDEVFNFYEPSHYLNHGHGFQTWEYSPVYAIRSWAYAGLHALLTLPARMLPLGTNNKTAEFYLLRIVLGFTCALCETRLFIKIGAILNRRIANTFVLVMATSPGMFHASISYLPSSFTMYTMTLGMAAFMNQQAGFSTAQGVFAVGAGAALGWPFAVAMAIPSLLEELVLASTGAKRGLIGLFWRLVSGAVRVFAILAAQVTIDSILYRRLVVVPFNIVWYNVFSGSGGPDLYGTEAWHFYLRNLALNFHLWLPLALLSMPLVLGQDLLSNTKVATNANSFRTFIIISPFYLWLSVFTLQPHKEERFMYPAYPALALNAAVTLDIIITRLNTTDPKAFVSKVPSPIRSAAVLVFIVMCFASSIFRILGTMAGFGAPLSIYRSLHESGIAGSGATVCLGKEWYRFPSHYLLPKGVHARFIKSEFSGLLPGEFHEGSAGSSFFPGAYLMPSGMNDQNREDPGKYTDIERCSLLVDSHLPSTETTKLEPNYMADVEHWERVECLSFLDAASTGIMGRLGYVPDLSFVPKRLRRVYGEYCLLRRRELPDVR